MVSKCSLSRRNFLGFCTVLLVEEGKTSIGATTLAHRSHGGVSVCKEYKISAEEISWPTLADTGRHPADMRFANLQHGV